jgi:hypothetical protein
MEEEVGAAVIRNFLSRRGLPGKEAGDDFDRIISRIERFAPKEYRTERDSHYYNYRMLKPYVSPLLVLLVEISKHSRLDEDTILLKGLFERLKGVYDPRNRLSLEEASKDPGLRRKFMDMLLYFYGKRGSPGGGVKRFLGSISVGHEERNEGVE